MVVALTGRQFADLAAATGLTETFGELERLLAADFGTDGDRYAHREVIAALLVPWFAGRTMAGIGERLGGTSVLWSRYRRFADLPGDSEVTGNPLLREIDQPGVGRVLAAASPLAHAGRPDPVPAPSLGADTADVLTRLLGLPEAEVRRLAERGIAGTTAGKP
jgi:2-methylfumaryl-CoA isomerase